MNNLGTLSCRKEFGSIFNKFPYLLWRFVIRKRTPFFVVVMSPLRQIFPHYSSLSLLFTIFIIVNRFVYMIIVSTSFTEYQYRVTKNQDTEVFLIAMRATCP